MQGFPDISWGTMIYLANEQYTVDLKLKLKLGSEEKRAGFVLFYHISLTGVFRNVVVWLYLILLLANGAAISKGATPGNIHFNRKVIIDQWLSVLYRSPIDLFPLVGQALCF